MTPNQLPLWATDSPQTESYTAVAGGPMLGSERSRLLDDTSSVFRAATDAFEKRLSCYPIDTSNIDFSLPVGWHNLSSELVDTFASSHWNLIREDANYRGAIGHVYDEARRQFHFTPVPVRSAVETYEVFIHEGQSLVTSAVYEGIATTVAVYQVVPTLARLAIAQNPGLVSGDVQSQLLSSARIFSNKMSRHSKGGNDYIIHKLQIDSPTAHNKINYESLTFDPAKFKVLQSAAGKLSLKSIVDARHHSDVMTPFNGCPAFEKGSVARINRLISDIITSDKLLERSAQY